MTAITTRQAEELFGASSGLANSVGNSGGTARERALELLGKGVKPSVVATILGVTPALVSQFQEDPLFKEAMQARLVESQLAQSVRDARLDALEDRVIGAVERSLDWFVKPTDALAALKLINGLQRRAPVNPVAVDDISTQTVVLNLPTSMYNSVVNIQVNTSNEVVEVNGREMRTMPSGQVMQELDKAAKQNSLNLERENEQRRIESSTTNTGRSGAGSILEGDTSGAEDISEKS